VLSLKVGGQTANSERKASAVPSQASFGCIQASQPSIEIDNFQFRRKIPGSFEEVFFSRTGVKKLEQLPREIFTLDISGRPTLALQAQSIEFARGICALPDFRLDLSEITSDGVPVCSADSVLEVRRATEEEVAAFKRGAGLAPAAEELTFVILIKVDRVNVVAIARQADDAV
jgi:hypothetical protein